jgi:hypothetical protein
MTTTTATKKLDIVREVIDIIRECEADGMEMCISMQVCLYLKDNYGYDRSEATQLLLGVELIDELGLLND